MDQHPDKHGIENTVDCGRWLAEKVSGTMARVAGGQARLLEHSDAMTLLERRLMACIGTAEQVRKPF